MTKLTKAQEKRLRPLLGVLSTGCSLKSYKKFKRDIADELSRQKKDLIEKLEKLDKVGAVKLKSGKIIRIEEFNLIDKDQAIKTLKKT